MGEHPPNFLHSFFSNFVRNIKNTQKKLVKNWMLVNFDKELLTFT